MDKYYYFVSQLPFLCFHQKPLLDSQGFLQEARKWLSQKDFTSLELAAPDVFSQSRYMPQVLISYRVFEKSLREALAFLRGATELRPEPQQLEKTKAILAGGDPLEKERKLLFARWQYIEELQAGHFFDISFIVLYYLKLQLLEQLFSFDKEKGQKVFDALCEVA